MKGRPLRVVIADDDPLACEAIRVYLEQSGFEVAGIARNGREALGLTEDLEPDVLLLDITMPDMDGLEALSAVKHLRPQTSVVILTGHRRTEYLARALVSGAGAYLTKDELDLKQLPEMIRMVIEGSEAVVGQDLLQAALSQTPKIASPSQSKGDADLESLTRQEKRVLELIAEGLSNSEIAEALVVTENTIKTHVSNIYSKLNVSDRTQAAILAFKMGLVK